MKQPKAKTPPQSKTSPKPTKSLADKLKTLAQGKQGKNRPSAAFIGGAQDAWRFYIIWGLMASIFVILVARAFWLQVWHVDFYLDKANQLITKKQPSPVYRGMILDTNKTLLAATSPLSSIIFSPYDYAQAYYSLKKSYINIKGDTPKSAKRKEKLKQALQKMDDDLKLVAQDTQVPYDTLKKAAAINERVDVNDAQAVKQALPRQDGSRRTVLLKDITPERAEAILSYKVKGIYEEKMYKRYYPQAEFNAQVLGYMAMDDEHKYVGRAGIERKYNQQLAGKAGTRLTLRGLDGSIEEVKELSPQIEGQNIELTIDARLQYILYTALKELGQAQSPLSSSGIVVDVLTGNVLAMTSWPSFNSNELKEMNGISAKNRVVADAFEPGSVMKPFTVAAALQSGKYNANTLINTSPGSLPLGNYVIKDSANYGAITMGKLIQKSSNVASAKIALSLPKNAIFDMQKKFGFGQKTSLNLPAEASGSLKAPQDNSRRATMAYGYGQNVTLAQLAQAYAALGNHGLMNHLRLVKGEEVPEPVQVIDARHAQSIVAMMQTVTEAGGTGTEAAINGYHVAGKTGTSRRADPVNGGYLEGQYRNIFAGLVPASNPRFAVVILVENPQKQKYAGQTVAPVFAKVAKETLRLYNIPFDKPLDASKE